MGNRHWNMQLMERGTGYTITATGGTCQVCTAGTPDKATLYDASGAALTNPIQLTTGNIDFYVVDTVATVDLYIRAPGGQFEIRTGVAPSGPNEIGVNVYDKFHLYKIPFSIADSVANTEKDTGFDLPTTGQVLSRLSGMGVLVTTLDSGQNVLFGTLTGESGGDPDGISTNVSLTTAVLKTGVAGALYSTNAPYLTDSLTAKSISYTLDTSTDTGKGFLLIPVLLT